MGDMSITFVLQMHKQTHKNIVITYKSPYGHPSILNNPQVRANNFRMLAQSMLHKNSFRPLLHSRYFCIGLS